MRDTNLVNALREHAEWWENGDMMDPLGGLEKDLFAAADRLEILRESDAIVLDEIRKAGLYREIWQSFAVLLPVRSVGVMGDARTYDYTIALRAVNSLDGMTADWVKLPYEVMGSISTRIINEVKGVNRVVYDISQKPPATIEWE